MEILGTQVVRVKDWYSWLKIVSRDGFLKVWSLNTVTLDSYIVNSCSWWEDTTGEDFKEV
jgi:hypothetical protein